MLRRAYASITRIVVIIGSLFVAGCRSEYQQGYEQGVREVREFRQQSGIAGELAIQAADELGAYSSKPDKSADWNAGYRAGAHDEIQK